MDYYNVAKIVNTRGLKGELRVISYTDFPEKRFKSGSILSIFKKESDKVPLTQVEINNSRPFKESYLLTFKNMNSINDVEKYKGMFLKIAADELSDLSDNEFYIHDIIGLDVFEKDHLIGSISDVLTYGPNDVWVVKRPHKNDLLLPYLKDVILDVDITANKVNVDVPEGLDE